MQAASSSISADLDLPDTFILSLSQGIGDRWELLGDISWTGWSSIPQVDIIRTSATTTYAAGSIAQRLDTKFDDAWRFAVGANYKLNEAWKLRFGIAYDQTPVPNAEYRLTSLPDNDRTWFSTGVQWKPEKNMARRLRCRLPLPEGCRDQQRPALPTGTGAWSRAATTTLLADPRRPVVDELLTATVSSSPGESGAFFRVFPLKKALTAAAPVL